MLKHDRSLLVVCGSFVKILFFEIYIISNLWLTRLRKVLKWSICAEREEMFKWSLFVYFQFFEIWNIIIAAKWHFRLFRYLTRFTKLFQQFCLSSFLFFWRGGGIGLGCLLWENSWRSIWRSLFFIEEKGSSMMQKVEYHGKGRSFRLSCWVFLMLP